MGEVPGLADDLTVSENDKTGSKYRILILGASYGSLLSTKLLLAGHDTTLICREATAALFNTEGSVVRTPIKAREGSVEIRSGELAGTLCASQPGDVDPSSFWRCRSRNTAPRVFVNCSGGSLHHGFRRWRSRICRFCLTSSVSQGSILIGCIVVSPRPRYGMILTRSF